MLSVLFYLEEKSPFRLQTNYCQKGLDDGNESRQIAV